MKRKILIIGIVLVVATSGLFMAFNKNDNNQSKGMSVKSYTIDNKKIESKVRVKGAVEAKEVKKIYIASAQKVEKVHYKAGDRVNAGDVIIDFDREMRDRLAREIETFKLDIENEKLQLESLKLPVSDLEVIQASNRVEDLKNALDSRKKSLALAETEVKNTQLRIENQKNSLESKRKLLEVGGISQSEYDRALEEERSLKEELSRKLINVEEQLALVSQGEGEVKVAEKSLEFTKMQFEDKKVQRTNNIKKLENNIKKYELSLLTKSEELKKMLDQITSPVNATILSMEAEDNYRVNIEKPLLELADISSQIIKTEIPTYDIGRVREGQKVLIKSSIIEGIDFEGSVTKISAIAHLKQSGNVSEKVVYAEVTPIEKNEVLKPGYDVDLEVVVEEAEKALVIPNIALVYEDDKTFVYVIKDDNSLEKREVTLGISDLLESEAIGLNEGERIVSNPSMQLSEGIVVEIEEKQDDKA